MRKGSLKKVLSVLLAASMAVPFAACGNGSSGTASSASTTAKNGAGTSAAGGKETITYWSGSATEQRNAFLTEKFAEFEKKNPNIKVEYLGVPGSASDLDQKLNMAVAGNEVPDVMQGFLTSSYITRKIVEPLDDYLGKSSVKNDISEKYIESFRDVDYKSKKLYAIPAPINVQMIYVRPDLITAAGLPVSMNTWNDFFTIAQKTTNTGKGIYGYIIRGGSGAAAAMEYQMYSYSGITSFFDKNGKCTINDPKNVEFCDKYLSGFKKYTSADDLNKSWTAMSSQFQSGKAVMLIHNTGSGPANFKAFTNDTKKIAGLTYPKSPYTQKVTVPQPTLNGYMLMSGSKHKAAAWKLIEFMQTPDVAGEFGKIFGMLPVTKSAQSQSWIQDSPYMKAASNCMNDSNTVLTELPYYLSNFTKIENDETAKVQQVMLGKLTSKQLLDEWAQKLQAEYDKVVKK